MVKMIYNSEDDCRLDFDTLCGGVIILSDNYRLPLLVRSSVVLQAAHPSDSPQSRRNVCAK